MLTFNRTFILPEGEREEALEKIARFYTEILPTRKGYIASKIEVSEDGKKAIGRSNWEKETDFEALEETTAFREMARRFG